MNKLGAVRLLIEGECDSILHGSSEYILKDGDVVNKRGKNKPLDMKNMLEEGWDTLSKPKWDTPLKNGEVRPTLCITEKSGIPVVIYRIDENNAYLMDGEDAYDGIYPDEGELRAATVEEALALVADTEKPSQKPQQKKAVAQAQELDSSAATQPSGLTAVSKSGEVPTQSAEQEPSARSEYASLGLPEEEWETFYKVCEAAGVSVESIREEGKNAMSQAIIAYLESGK